MREGYGSHFVSVCVCVCYRTSGYRPDLYVRSEAAYNFFRLLKAYIAWTSLKLFHLGDMAVFVTLIGDSALS